MSDQVGSGHRMERENAHLDCCGGRGVGGHRQKPGAGQSPRSLWGEPNLHS